MLQKNKLIYFFLTALLFIYSFSVHASNSEAQRQNPYLVFDRSETKKIYQSISIYDYPDNYRENTAYKMIGTAQFTGQQFDNILRKHHVLPGQFIVVDLRAESHGFLSGRPVSWYLPGNKANHGKNISEILEDEKIRIKNIQEIGSIKLYNRSGNTIAYNNITKITSEEELLSSKNINYIRIPWNDHEFPTPQMLDMFINTIYSIPQDAWVILHCHAGKGRTTLAMVIIQMIRDNPDIDFEKILEENLQLGGIDLSIEYAKHLSDPIVRQYYHERAVKLCNFYYYMVMSELKIPYVEWIKNYGAAHINCR